MWLISVRLGTIWAGSRYLCKYCSVGECRDFLNVLEGVDCCAVERRAAAAWRLAMVARVNVPGGAFAAALDVDFAAQLRGMLGSTGDNASAGSGSRETTMGGECPLNFL